MEDIGFSRSTALTHGAVICSEQGANDLHMVWLMPLPPSTPSSLASLKIQNGLPF